MTDKENSILSFTLFCVRNFRNAISCIFVVCFLIIVVGNGIIHAQIQNIHANYHVDAVIVLGYKLEKDPIRPTQALKNRLDIAYQYWLEEPDVPIIVSGAKTQGFEKSEAEVMREYLMMLGIPSESIVVEEKSTRTAQQFVNSMALMNIDSALIITNDFHLPRSIMLAFRSGIEDVSGLAAQTPTDTHSLLTAYIREPFALLNSWLFDHP